METWSRVSSGSIVSDYGLDDRAIGVRSTAGEKDFSSSLCVQTGSGAHPASCTMGTAGPFPGAKARPRRDADHSPLSSAEVVNEEPYLLSPPSASMACRGTALPFFTHTKSLRTPNVVVEWLTPLLLIREVAVHFSTRRLFWCFHGFPQSLQENAGIVP
jgi:hypothetical protein